jgi:hypothetical protein
MAESDPIDAAAIIRFAEAIRLALRRLPNAVIERWSSIRSSETINHDTTETRDW